MPPSGDARPWVAKAEQDYRASLALMRVRALEAPDIVCFHAQQCAEKYLKAFLVLHRIPFPKTHDLDRLLRMATTEDAGLGDLRPPLKRLMPYAIDVRYPGARATAAKARQAMRDARRVREIIRRRLRLP